MLQADENPIPIKHALNQVDFNVGNPRLPLVPPSERAASQIREVMANYEIDIPVPE